MVSGSGTGAGVIRRLTLAGFDVSAGALAHGDTDHEVASTLGVPMVELQPYGGISEADETAVGSAARKADVVVVCATPFGHANVGNLRAAAGAARPTVLVGELTAEDDFTDVEASALWSDLLSRGARACTGTRYVVRAVEEANRS